MVCDCGCSVSCEVDFMVLKKEKRGVKVGVGFKGERKVVKNG